MLQFYDLVRFQLGICQQLITQILIERFSFIKDIVIDHQKFNCMFFESLQLDKDIKCNFSMFSFVWFYFLHSLFELSQWPLLATRSFNRLAKPVAWSITLLQCLLNKVIIAFKAFCYVLLNLLLASCIFYLLDQRCTLHNNVSNVKQLTSFQYFHCSNLLNIVA